MNSYRLVSVYLSCYFVNSDYADSYFCCLSRVCFEFVCADGKDK